jgi:hypothetical protein
MPRSPALQRRLEVTHLVQRLISVEDQEKNRFLQKIRERCPEVEFSLTPEGSLKVECSSEHERKRLPLAILHAASFIVVDGSLVKDRTGDGLPILSALERILGPDFLEV